MLQSGVFIFIVAAFAAISLCPGTNVLEFCHLLKALLMIPLY